MVAGVAEWADDLEEVAYDLEAVPEEPCGVVVGHLVEGACELGKGDLEEVACDLVAGGQTAKRKERLAKLLR